jgi:hypothetical protein
VKLFVWTYKTEFDLLLSIFLIEMYNLRSDHENWVHLVISINSSNNFSCILIEMYNLRSDHENWVHLVISINSSNNFSCIHLRFSFHTLSVHLACPFVIVSSSIFLVLIPSVFPFVCHCSFLMFVIFFEFI